MNVKQLLDAASRAINPSFTVAAGLGNSASAMATLTLSGVTIISPGSVYGELAAQYQPTPLERIMSEMINHLYVMLRRAGVPEDSPMALTEEEKAHILRFAWECRSALSPELAVYASLAGGLAKELKP